VYEPQFRPATLNATERKQLVRKAKADRMAFDAADMLSRGQTTQATTLAGECLTLAGKEQLTLWLRHYAVTKFKMARGAVDEFLDSMPPADVAI